MSVNITKAEAYILILPVKKQKNNDCMRAGLNEIITCRKQEINLSLWDIITKWISINSQNSTTPPDNNSLNSTRTKHPRKNDSYRGKEVNVHQINKKENCKIAGTEIQGTLRSTKSYGKPGTTSEKATEPRRKCEQFNTVRIRPHHQQQFLEFY